MIFQYGKHRVRHGSMTDDLSELMNGEIADYFYCDPPWGAGTLKAFETLNHKKGESAPRIELNYFMMRLFNQAITHSKNLIFIEYGIKWEEMIKAAAAASGLKHLKTIETVYKSGSKILPHHVHVFSKNNLSQFEMPQSYYDSISTISNAAGLVESILRPIVKENEIVLDPCCGLGATAQAAKKLGMRFFGNELTKARLEKTIKVIT